MILSDPKFVQRTPELEEALTHEDRLYIFEKLPDGVNEIPKYGPADGPLPRIPASQVNAKEGFLQTCGPCKQALSCDKTPKFSPLNGFWLHYRAPELDVLSRVEMRMISLVRLKVNVYKLGYNNRGTYGHKGTCWAIHNKHNVVEIAKRLPRRMEDTGAVILRQPGFQGRGRVMEFRVNPKSLRAALLWLKRYNPLYADIEIDEDYLAELDNQAAAENSDVADLYDSVPNAEVELPEDPQEKATADAAGTTTKPPPVTNAPPTGLPSDPPRAHEAEHGTHTRAHAWM